ncbi:MAG: DUF2953 domain-containing protein [Bacteroidales bacterium]|nr:DUF2953 domain-containing protein [Bacteroidales bacterium]
MPPASTAILAGLISATFPLINSYILKYFTLFVHQCMQYQYSRLLDWD